MRVRFRGILAVVLWGVGLAAVSAQEAPPLRPVLVDFHVNASDPASGQVAVTMEVSGFSRERMLLGIPAWRPGSYRLQKYDAGYLSLTAERPDGVELKVERPDPRTFAVATGGADPVKIRYVLKPGAADLNEEHFHIDGVASYPYVKEIRQGRTRVRFTMPEGWQTATGLEKVGDHYVARDYDTFADCPTELGRFTMRRFEQDGVTYELALHGKAEFDVDAFVEMHRKIVAEPVKLFGGAPFDRFVFFYHFTNRFGGYGLEHLNSTIIEFHGPALAREVRTIAPLTSHEFFHAWNVKRIRPMVLGPFDYTGPVRTRALWWCEGVTDYYASLLLARAGLMTEGQYLASLASEISRLQNTPERLTMSVETSSWTVWEGPQPVDYYNKGHLLGMLLDLRIRRLTDNARSLDDVMRFLDGWFVKGGGGPIGVGFEEGDLLRAVNTVSGRDFSAFFAAAVSGTEELPYAEELAAAGLKLTLEYAERPFSGLSLRGNTVRRVTGAAEAAGLRPGDRITALDGADLAEDGVRKAVGDLKAGARVRLGVRRGEETLELPLEVGVRRQVSECAIDRGEAPTPPMERLRASWLSGS